MKFRSKFGPVEAIQIPVKEDAGGWGLFAVWMLLNCKESWWVSPNAEGVTIDTLRDGRMHGKSGDYVVAGNDGEIFPVNPHTFFEHYERVV